MIADMKSLGTTTLLLGALGMAALAGCGGTPSAHRSPAVAANLLGASNTAALNTSFEASFSAGASVDISGLTGLPASTRQQLRKAVQTLNGASLKGTLQYQSSGTFELSYSLPPVLTQKVTLLEVGGAAYVSLNGNQWYSAAAAAPGSLGGSLPGKLGNLRSELRNLGKQLKSATRVTDLGSGGTVNGVATDHLRATVAGSALNGVLANAITQFGSGRGSGLGALTSLITFGSTTVNSWVATGNHRPQRVTANSSMTLNLGALSLLAPGSAPTVGGSASVAVHFAVNFSRYGASFGLQKPASVLPGAPALPSGPLSQFA